MTSHCTNMTLFPCGLIKKKKKNVKKLQFQIALAILCEPETVKIECHNVFMLSAVDSHGLLEQKLRLTWKKCDLSLIMVRLVWSQSNNTIRIRR